MNCIVTNTSGAKHVALRLTPHEIRERGIRLDPRAGSPEDIVGRLNLSDILIAHAYRSTVDGKCFATWYGDVPLETCHDLVTAMLDNVPA
jgi:hypothetical protein